jgi:hypothetical protein
MAVFPSPNDVMSILVQVSGQDLFFTIPHVLHRLIQIARGI